LVYKTSIDIRESGRLQSDHEQQECAAVHVGRGESHAQTSALAGSNRRGDSGAMEMKCATANAGYIGLPSAGVGSTG
jgi:hypothetical protein